MAKKGAYQEGMYEREKKEIKKETIVREVRLFEEGGEEGEKAVPSALQAARGQRSAVRRGRRSGMVKHEARQRPCRACAGELKPAFTCLADRPQASTS